MKILSSLALIVLLAGCAGNPTTKNDLHIKYDGIYKLKFEHSSKTFFVKFIQEDLNKHKIAFLTDSVDTTVNSSLMNTKNVRYVDEYYVDKKGEISFRYYEKGTFEENKNEHIFFRAASQSPKKPGHIGFRYVLDLSRFEYIPFNN